MDLKHLIAVDETGATTSMTRTYGRAKPGVRVVEPVPQKHWQITTFITAMRPSGELCTMAIAGPVNGTVFRAYVENVLAPMLRKGDVVLWDNLPAHKVAGVAEAVARKGARIEDLPKYSPDFMPMELGFSKIKTVLRKAKARTHETLVRAYQKASNTLTAADARAWFRHCGYGRLNE